MDYIDKQLLIDKLRTDSKYEELLDEINSGKYDYKDYKHLCMMLAGKKISDCFCNGFFGSDNYNLEGAEVKKVYKSDSDCITIEVKKTNNKYDYGYFEGDWCDWETVYKHLNEWIFNKDQIE